MWGRTSPTTGAATANLLAFFDGLGINSVTNYMEKLHNDKGMNTDEIEGINKAKD